MYKRQGLKRTQDLRTLWKGTGISRKRKIELVESLIGTKILYNLETLNITPAEEDMIDVAQYRIYRRALGLATVYFAVLEGKEVVKNEELLTLARNRPWVKWTTRIHTARHKLLMTCRSAGHEEPIRSILLAPHSITEPRNWPGKRLPGANYR